MSKERRDSSLTSQDAFELGDATAGGLQNRSTQIKKKEKAAVSSFTHKIHDFSFRLIRGAVVL